MAKQNINEILVEVKASIDPEVWNQAAAEVDADFAALKIAIEVRHARRAASLTQTQLSEKSGITQSEISRIEKGRYAPRLSTLYALARALKTDFVITGRQPERARVA